MYEKRRPFLHLMLVFVFLLSTYPSAAGQAEFRQAATTVGGIINTDTTCNPKAAGNRVSANVVYQPFLTAGNSNPTSTSRR